MIFIIAAILLFVIFSREVLTGDSVNVTAVYNTYRSEINDASTLFGIPIPRIVAIIMRESSGNANAKGSAGEIGLMQITKGALADYNRVDDQFFSMNDLTDPRTNIQVGAGYLAIIRKHYTGDLDKATQAYNAGMGTVDRDPNASEKYLLAVKSFENQFTNSTT